MLAEESRQRGPAATALGTAADYLSLAKPKAMTLVVITALAAMVVAQAGVPPLGLLLATLLGGSLSSAGANALNCYVDRDIDALMRRTRARPLPAGRLSPGPALVFGLGLSVLGVAMLALGVNAFAAGLAAVANAFYVVVYTGFLKRRTDQNIVIGGLAGATAPLIGYAAVAGRLDATALALAALVLCWTPPHFWSLALLSAADYRRAAVPMLPVVRGPLAAKRQIVVYAVLAGLVALLPALRGPLGAPYLAVAVALGLVFVGLATRLGDGAGDPATRRLFRFSIVYLGTLCLAMVADRLMF
ncbi:MAG: heme o synthase [Chloroflexota bacterium]